jgi:hypothetical protein
MTKPQRNCLNQPRSRIIAERDVRAADAGKWIPKVASKRIEIDDDGPRAMIQHVAYSLKLDTDIACQYSDIGMRRRA